ncbi:MAG: DUF4173 domain-containing protein [Defluviitaleaceae bacterium]|nr:DUF4173 domain-containing protein [Defluviitaleaceae bacterium]MCL2240056.1 DUF4173 domain-containing protein [Defluviitaleaceae bacterium]
MTTNENAANIPIPNKRIRVYTTGERLLLVAALVVAVLFDRLMFAPLLAHTRYYPLFAGAFWLCFLGLFCLFFWRKLRRNRVAWYVAGCVAALCLWGFFFWRGSSHGYFGLFNHAVIPGVLMALVVFVAGEFSLKDASGIARAWLRGWFIKPFSGIPDLFGVMGSLLAGENKSTAKKVAIGVGVTLPLLLILLPLLANADVAFGYHMAQFFRRWDFASLVGHTTVVIFAFGFFYSFLWNAQYNAREKTAPGLRATQGIDAVISGIVLGTVIVLYILFCAVMFTYLFAGAGLPGGMTYYEYARQGFAQTVAVCAINLLIYAVFLHYGKGGRALRGLLVGLLALTGVMLFSGFVRLGLYIDAFGMTWLRLISAWFIIYLAAVIFICLARIWKEKLPAIALCALLLLGWYVALGYLNPDGFIAWYNARFGYDVWVLVGW